MPLNQITPLAPAYVLLIGAALVLVVGPALTPRRRHGLMVAISALAVLSLFLVGQAPSSVPTGEPGEGLGELAFGLRVPAFEPYLWILTLSLLAISLAGRGSIDPVPALDQAMLFALTATACGVVLAGNYATLAAAILLFDGVAALFALTTRQPGRADFGELSRANFGELSRADFGELSRAVGRLLLGVLSSAAVMALAQNTEYLPVESSELGGIFALTVWLRLGLYPLAESDAPGDSFLPVQLGWTVVNLAVGLYLISASAPPWLVWLAGATMLLHGALAWLEPSQQLALARAGMALAGGILTITAASGTGSGLPAASLSILAALVALELTLPVLGRNHPDRAVHFWSYLPALLATASLLGVPFTLGWWGRGALYQASWEIGSLVTLALVVVAEGAALSALYPYWQRLLRSEPGKVEHAIPSGDEDSPEPLQGEQSSMEQGSGIQIEGDVWYLLGATLACIPFLIPVLGPRLVPDAPLTSVQGPTDLIPLLALVGSLLWALFLGYGRRHLLSSAPFSRRGLMDILRLDWLLRSLGYGLGTLGSVLLRMRAVIEGEHYLAWAILLALGLGLVIVLR
jgi:hypothetical protein